MITLCKKRRAQEYGILEALRRNTTATANLQHEAIPQCHGNGGRGQQPAPPQGASDKTSGSISASMPSSASPGIPPEPPAAFSPAIVPGFPQCHGTGGRGQQLAPSQGASDKTSGSISTSMPSSASPGISPELPAVHGPLLGDDETARLPSPVSRLSPLAASKRPAGALSPTDVALFPTFPSPTSAA